MLLHNVDTPKGLVNGQTGTIKGFQPPTGRVHQSKFGLMKLGNDDESDRILRGAYDRWYNNNKIGTTASKNEIQNSLSQGLLPVVEWDNHEVSIVEPNHWRVEDNHGKLRAWRIQLPLRHAWAVSIHKSQGLSLDSVQVDIANCFENGMAYVALSRCRFLHTLYIPHGFVKEKVMVNPEVKSFYKASNSLLAFAAADEEPEDPAASRPPAYGYPTGREFSSSSSPQVDLSALKTKESQLRTTSHASFRTASQVMKSGVAPASRSAPPATKAAAVDSDDDSSDLDVVESGPSHVEIKRGAGGKPVASRAALPAPLQMPAVPETSDDDLDEEDSTGSATPRPATARRGAASADLPVSSSPPDAESAGASYLLSLSRLRDNFGSQLKGSPPNSQPPQKKRKF